jgi:hypothetical protein
MAGQLNKFVVKKGDADLENVDALMRVAMKMEMDLVNKISSFEELILINPLNDKKSRSMA